MLRYCATILLLIAFTLQTFERTWMVIDYYANTGAFAKNCENKFKPGLHCNGQCVLMKKLKEQESKDEQNPERRPESKSDVIYSHSFFATLSPTGFKVISTSYPPAFEGTTRCMPRTFFHPPNLC